MLDVVRRENRTLQLVGPIGSAAAGSAERDQKVAEWHRPLARVSEEHRFGLISPATKTVVTGVTLRERQGGS